MINGKEGMDWHQKEYHSYLLKRKVWFLRIWCFLIPHLAIQVSQRALFMEVQSQVLQGLLRPESHRTIGRFSNPPYTCDRELGIWCLFEEVWLAPLECLAYSVLVCVPGGLLSGGSLRGILRGWFDKAEPQWQRGALVCSWDHFSCLSSTVLRDGLSIMLWYEERRITELSFCNGEYRGRNTSTVAPTLLPISLETCVPNPPCAVLRKGKA